MSFGFLPDSGVAGNLIAPAGTRIPMQQASAPFGWTSDSSAAMNDCSLRINSGTGGATSGSTGWSTWNFGGTVNINTFTLSIAQLPAHNHSATDSGHAHSITDNGHTHNFGQNSANIVAGNGAPTLQSNSQQTSLSGTGISINNGTANVTIGNTGTGAGITPSITTPQVKYADHIMAVKS